MMFRRSIERALAFLKEWRAKRDAERHGIPYEEDMHLEKGDRRAMLISAFLVLIPAVILVLGIMVLVVWLFFFR